MEKYDLKSKPELIYNLEESGFCTEHKPPVAIKPKGPINAITSPRSNTTTLIACVNVIGMSLPPYLIFKGKRTNDDLKKGASPGTVIRMSDSDWSNGQLFIDYAYTSSNM